MVYDIKILNIFMKKKRLITIKMSINKKWMILNSKQSYWLIFESIYINFTWTCDLFIYIWMENEVGWLLEYVYTQVHKMNHPDSKKKTKEKQITYNYIFCYIKKRS